MITANLATHSGRKDTVKKAVESIANQVDLVRVWANDYTPTFPRDNVEVHTGQDLTDNGKFAFVDDSYYFTIDDDILYPDDYVEVTMRWMNKYPNHIITYHGRKLGKGTYYHGDHHVYRFNRTVRGNWEVDVPGTGVMAMKGFYVDPLQWEHKRMSDLMMGLECAKRGKKILCVQHPIYWIRPIKTNSSIYEEEHTDDSIQTEVANRIREYSL